jgi:hypothetical protein
MRSCTFAAVMNSRWIRSRSLLACIFVCGCTSGRSGFGNADAGVVGTGATVGMAPNTGIPVRDASASHAAIPASTAPTVTDSGLRAGAKTIAGMEFFQRIVGQWTGTNSNTPLGFDFPMTIDFAPSGDSFMYGNLTVDPTTTIAFGFNIETYDGQDVLTYRNAGFGRDSRLKLIEHDAATGYYRFCAVEEWFMDASVPIADDETDRCNNIDARYTFSAPDRMLLVVTTLSGKPHVHWDATRIATHTLPDPFPASIVSQGNGSAPWPASALIGFPSDF